MSSKRLADKKRAKKKAEKKAKALRSLELKIGDRQQRNLDFAQEKARMGKLPPFRNAAAPAGSESAEEIIGKLAHNIEILRELEKEYDVAQEERAERNRQLEEQGHFDLESKLKAVHEQVISGQSASGLSFGGEADVVFTPNEDADGDTIVVDGTVPQADDE